MAKRSLISDLLPLFARPGRRIFYGWWLVGLAVFMLTLMASTSFQGIGMYLVALERKFGWSRTVLSAPFSLARVQGAVIGPLEGWLIDRVGSRRMVLIGYTTMGIGFVMFSQIDSVWQYIVTYTIISVGGGLGGWLAIITMVNNWFIRRRSLALATAMSGVHFGGFLVYVLALGLEYHGFRTTMLGIGLFLLATTLPMGLIIRSRPEDIGLRPDGDPAPSGDTATGRDPGRVAAGPEPDFTARQALRTPVFWILAVVHMTSTISIVTLAAHLVPKLNDMGFSLTQAGLVISAYTCVAIVTQFVAGYLGDRLPKPPLIFGFLLLQAASLFVLATAEAKPLAPRVRIALRSGHRRTRASHDGDQRRLLRPQGLRDDHGALDAAQQLRDDGGAGVRGIHVRHHRLIPGAVPHLRSDEPAGRARHALRTEANDRRSGAAGLALSTRRRSPLRQAASSLWHRTGRQ